MIQRPWDSSFDEYSTYTLRDQTAAERPHKASDLKYTDGGRKVYGGGGIEPDKFVVGAVEGFNPSRFGRLLVARQAFLNFADQFTAEGDTRLSAANKSKKTIARGFVVNDAMLNDFKAMLTTQKVKFDAEGFAADDTFIRAMIHFEIDAALFGMDEARHNLITKDPQAQFALTQFSEAERLLQLTTAKTASGAVKGQ
jgi:carboxyl-terminal processing protease